MLGQVYSVILVLLVSLPLIYSEEDSEKLIRDKKIITEIVDGINEVRSLIALGNLSHVITNLHNQSNRPLNENVRKNIAIFNQSLAYYRKVYYRKGLGKELEKSRMNCDSADTWSRISDDMLIMTFKRYTQNADKLEQNNNFEKYNVAWPYLEQIIKQISQLSEKQFAAYSVLHESLYKMACTAESEGQIIIEHQAVGTVCMKCIFKGKAIKDTNFQFGEKCSKCTKSCANDGLCDEGSSSNNTIYVSILIFIAAYLIN